MSSKMSDAINNILKKHQRYKPTGTVFSGGMGDVYLCRDQYLERDIAIKFIKHPENISRLMDEIVALQAIRSKHVVQIYDLLWDEKTRILGIVQEYLIGEDLSSLLKKDLSREEYLKVLFQIASGISDIHEQGLVHRDVKPQNMKFDQEHIIKIFDFGLARIIGKNNSTLGFTGTPYFSAPELYDNNLVHFTQKIDVYSFGIIALFLATASDLSKIPREIIPNPKPQPIKNFSFSELPVDIPSDIVHLLDLSIAYEHQKRPQIGTIRDMIARYLLYGRHKALIMSQNRKYTLDKNNKTARLSNQEGTGSLTITYDGLYFRIESVYGSILINNSRVQKGYTLPDACVIGFEGSRIFTTFDVSRPEVVL